MTRAFGPGILRASDCAILLRSPEFALECRPNIGGADDQIVRRGIGEVSSFIGVDSLILVMPPFRDLRYGAAVASHCGYVQTNKVWRCYQAQP